MARLENHAPSLDRLGDVLDPLRAHRGKADRELACNLLTHPTRDADPTRLGQALQPGGDVDAVAVDVVVLDDDVAGVDADAEADLLVLGDARLALGHAALDGDGTGDRVDDAAELAQHAIAHELDNPAVVLGQEWLEELLAVRLEAGERAGLVMAHEPRVADHVRRQDGGEPPIDARSGHGCGPHGAADGAMLPETGSAVRSGVHTSSTSSASPQGGLQAPLTIELALARRLEELLVLRSRLGGAGGLVDELADDAEAATLGVLAQRPELGLGVLAAVLGRDPRTGPL